MTHLLDTNAWIAYIRGKNTQLIARVNSHPPANLGLSTIALGELMYGAYHGDPAYLAKSLFAVGQLRRTFRLVPFGEDCADHFGQIHAYLSGIGQKIGSNDTLIAATARAHGLTLVTHNTNEFSRVPGLKLEDWQIP